MKTLTLSPSPPASIDAPFPARRHPDYRVITVEPLQWEMDVQFDDPVICRGLQELQFSEFSGVPNDTPSRR